MGKDIRIALPKGRLGEKVYTMLAKAGYPCEELMGDSRKLVFENPEKGVRYFWVKPSDAAVYAERGAADIGIVGWDVLKETRPDVYELMDLGLGKCRMAVAAPEDFEDRGDRVLKVATKYPRIAADYYGRLGRDIDIIHLNGSVELAPLLHLSDVIVDIVETGKTLKENGLVVKAEILSISAHLVANKACYHFNCEQVDALVAALQKIKEEEA